jgi:Lrp/AsnC family transcriptional regulator, leucine-responsive regulatory protein
MHAETLRSIIVDQIDEQIFGELRHNARLSFSELGRRVGLSTNAVMARVRKLEAEGTIAGYTVVSATQIARPGALEVYIDVRLADGFDDADFLAAVHPLGEVLDAVHLTGGFDFLVRAVVADTASLDQLVKRLKRECGAGQTQTRVALRPARLN